MGIEKGLSRICKKDGQNSDFNSQQLACTSKPNPMPSRHHKRYYSRISFIGATWNHLQHGSFP